MEQPYSALFSFFHRTPTTRVEIEKTEISGEDEDHVIDAATIYALTHNKTAKDCMKINFIVGAGCVQLL